MSSAAPEVVELVERVILMLVDDPAAVRVTDLGDESVCLIEVSVAPRDRGKIIGKHGATANAIRTLRAAFGGKNKRRFVLEIAEEDRPSHA